MARFVIFTKNAPKTSEKTPKSQFIDKNQLFNILCGGMRDSKVRPISADI